MAANRRSASPLRKSLQPALVRLSDNRAASAEPVALKHGVVDVNTQRDMRLPDPPLTQAGPKWLGLQFDSTLYDVVERVVLVEYWKAGGGMSEFEVGKQSLLKWPGERQLVWCIIVCKGDNKARALREVRQELQTALNNEALERAQSADRWRRQGHVIPALVAVVFPAERAWCCDTGEQMIGSMRATAGKVVKLKPHERTKVRWSDGRVYDVIVAGTAGNAGGRKVLEQHAERMAGAL